MLGKNWTTRRFPTREQSKVIHIMASPCSSQFQRNTGLNKVGPLHFVSHQDSARAHSQLVTHNSWMSTKNQLSWIFFWHHGIRSISINWILTHLWSTLTTYLLQVSLDEIYRANRLYSKALINNIISDYPSILFWPKRERRAECFQSMMMGRSLGLQINEFERAISKSRLESSTEVKTVKLKNNKIRNVFAWKVLCSLFLFQ